MAATLVAVCPLSVPQDPSTAIAYRLVPCRTPPAFDPKPMLKTKLMWGRALKIYNAIFTFILPAAFPLFWVGFIARIAAFFVLGPVGNAAAIVSVLLQLPSAINMFIGARIGFLQILIRSYDFCFHQAVMTACIVTFGFVLHSQPVKLVMLLFLWIELSNGLIVDACLLHNTRTILWSALSSCGFVALLVFGIAFGRIAGADHHEIVLSPSHSVGTQDILSNAMITQLMLFVRLMHNSKVNLQQDANNPLRTAIQSRMVRCALHWELILDGKISPQHRRTSSVLGSTTFASSDAALGLLTLTPKMNHNVYYVNDTLVPSISAWLLRKSTLQQILWRILPCYAVCGVSMTIFCLATAIPPIWLAVCAQIITCCCCVIVVFCCQPQVLKQLINSFNFIFLSTQITVGLICLCDAFRWDTYKVLGIVDCWVWLHLILTVDAMMPLMKNRLRFNLGYILPVILLTLVGQIIVIVEIVWKDNWHLQNRVLWRVEMSDNHGMVIHSASVLLGRLATLVVSFLRLTYLVVTRSSDDELFLLQCPVEYDYRGWKKTRTALGSVDAE